MLDSVYGPRHWHVMTTYGDGITIPDTHTFTLRTQTKAEVVKSDRENAGYRHVSILECNYLACTKYGKYDDITQWGM